jgi:Mrp family chromosome partitioning ATPase
MDESRIISAFCDATILVVDEWRCRRRDLRSAAEGLRAVGAKLTGIVLNQPQHVRVSVVRSVLGGRKRHRHTPVAASPHLADPV